MLSRSTLYHEKLTVVFSFFLRLLSLLTIEEIFRRCEDCVAFSGKPTFECAGCRDLHFLFSNAADKQGEQLTLPHAKTG